MRHIKVVHTTWGHIRKRMENRRDQLKRLVAHYRRLLAEGVDGAMAQIYVREIIKAETELAILDKDTDRRE